MVWKNARKLNNRKKEQLGMNTTTAKTRLLRLITLNLLRRLGEDKCYVCKQALTIEDFSIEHIKDWLSIDSNLFWDIDNIAFSHVLCNKLKQESKNKKP